LCYNIIDILCDRRTLMKNRAIALMITAQLLAPALAYAADGYAGGKLSGKYGPNSFESNTNVVASTGTEDENSSRLQRPD
jgi:uncharacterized protein YraI